MLMLLSLAISDITNCCAMKMANSTNSEKDARTQMPVAFRRMHKFKHKENEWTTIEIEFISVAKSKLVLEVPHSL